MQLEQENPVAIDKDKSQEPVTIGKTVFGPDEGGWRRTFDSETGKQLGISLAHSVLQVVGRGAYKAGLFWGRAQGALAALVVVVLIKAFTS